MTKQTVMDTFQECLCLPKCILNNLGLKNTITLMTFLRQFWNYILLYLFASSQSLYFN